MGLYFKYGIFSFVLIILQTTLLHFISVEGITPDLLTIWVVYLALSRGQMRGTIWGFGIGLLFDFATGNFIGLAALTKTIAGFAAGYFFNETKTRAILGSYRFLLVVLIVSLIQNSVYFVIFTRGSDIGIIEAVLKFGVTTALYTGTVSLIPIFRYSRQSLA